MFGNSGLIFLSGVFCRNGGAWYFFGFEKIEQNGDA
jgi:hypothetical protein